MESKLYSTNIHTWLKKIVASKICLHNNVALKHNLNKIVLNYNVWRKFCFIPSKMFEQQCSFEKKCLNKSLGSKPKCLDTTIAFNPNTCLNKSKNLLQSKCPDAQVLMSSHACACQCTLISYAWRRDKIIPENGKEIFKETKINKLQWDLDGPDTAISWVCTKKK